MEIREERPDDLDGVRSVHIAAFGDRGPSVAALVDALRAGTPADRQLSLVAVDGATVVGHALFTESLLDASMRRVQVQVLSPLGVLPDRQRCGVGGLLVERGVDHLSEGGAARVPGRLAGLLRAAWVQHGDGPRIPKAFAADP
jgi:putative acetyltransferase